MSASLICTTGAVQRILLLGFCTLALFFSRALVQAKPDFLTPDERAWLKGHGPLRWSTNSNVPPYGFLNASKEFDGIAPEMMALLAQRLGVELKPVVYATWTDTLAGIRRGECDLLAAAIPTEDRQQYLQFTNPYQNLPVILFVKRGEREIKGIKDLGRRRVGVSRNTMTDEWMRREHPEINVVLVETAREGFLLLAMGQLDAMASSLALGHYVITKNALNNLAVLPDSLLFSSPHCLAVNKSNDRLLSILQKALNNLPKPELQEIFTKWSGLDLKPAPWQFPTWVWQGALALLAAWLLIIAWNHLLRRRVAQQAKQIRDQVEKEREMEKRCAELVENATDMVFTRDMEGNYISINPAGCRRLGYTQEEVPGLHITDLVVPEYSEGVQQRIDAQLAGKETSDYQLELLSKDGRRIWFEVSLRLLYKDGKAVAVQGIARDISKRKEAEVAVEQERKFLRTLIDNMPDLVYTKDMEGRFVLSNTAHVRFMGMKSEADLAGKTVLDLHPPELARAYYADDLHVIRSGDVIQNREELVQDHNGVVHWHLTIKAPLCDRDGKIIGLVGVSRDINEHKRALESLRESELLYHSLVEQLPQSIFRKDIEGRVTFANSRYCQGMQREPKDILGKTDADLFPPDLAAKYRADDKRVIETGTVFEAIERHRAPDGREFYVHVMKSPLRDIDGQIVGTQCIFWDVTGRKLTEDALRESEQRLRLATEAAQMGTWDRDLKNNKLFWSATQERLMGYRPGTFPGTYEVFCALVHPDSRDVLVAAQKKAKETGEYSAELQFQLRDGRTRWGLVRGQIIYDDQGKPERILGVDLDITKRKQAEEEVARLNEELEQRVEQRTAELATSNKELEAFCYSVSHDLRTPLRSIDGFSALVVERCSNILDATTLDYLQRSREAAQQMGHLINDLLQLSRVTRCELHHEPVDLSNLASTIAEDLRNSLPNRQVLYVIEQNLVARGDPRLLRIVIENLLNNAWKFTALEPQPKIEFGRLHENGLTTYFVRDNGAGFDMTYVHKLFEPFQRLHSVSEFSGTGVGLASVQRIIRRHGGRVWAKGAVGYGATFYFTLQTESTHT
ncbi:MAG: PAS domain S-box protein [Verrucomicrobia bacterium]|nr:PAS domain S-box protein [Verrucomicrobiota bacterium]